MNHKLAAFLLAFAGFANCTLAPAAQAGADDDIIHNAKAMDAMNDAGWERTVCGRQMINGGWSSPDLRARTPSYDCYVSFMSWKTKGAWKQGWQAPGREDYEDWQKEMEGANRALAEAEWTLERAKGDCATWGADTFSLVTAQAEYEKARAAYVETAKRDPMVAGLIK